VNARGIGVPSAASKAKPRSRNTGARSGASLLAAVNSSTVFRASALEQHRAQRHVDVRLAGHLLDGVW
jgi:hypothetical protein